MDKSKLNYSPATVYEQRGYFRIIFYWRPEFNQPLKRFRKNYGVNRVHDLSARRKAAYLMADCINLLLQQGWNPETDSLPQNAVMNAHPKPETKPTVSTLEAVNLALKRKIIRVPKARSVQAYKSYTKQFAEWLQKTKYGKYPINEFTGKHAQDYQDFLINTGISFVTVNTKLEYLTALFKMIVKDELTDKNPFASVDKLKEKKTTYYELFTAAELQAIKKHLTTNSPELWQFFLFIYFCFMRPLSICHIRKRDINVAEKLIRIDGEDNKNGNDAFKQLLDVHLKYLLPYIAKLKPNDYLFSSNKLKPGRKPVIRNRASELWHAEIIEKLGIDKKMYGAKHTGAANYLINNPGMENLKWLQFQMNHSDLQTTSIYTNKLRVIMLDEDKANISDII